ncbi:MAG: DUF4349 domain-containing protein [Oscillospiraceae bacterium]|nr:DUF4349 domain-containing protein [Oscillospiraceae bacterium]
MKKQFLFSIAASALCAVLLTGCSSSDNASDAAMDSYYDNYYYGSNDGGNYQYIAEAFSKGSGDYKSDENYYAETTTASYNYDYDYEEMEDAASDSEYDYPEEDYSIETAEVNEEALEAENPQNSAEASLKKEMLVYYCTMEIDTLDFESALNTFKNTLDMYGGFIEQENYSDGGSGGRWYSESSEKWQSYTATLRVPSKNYEDFCNSAGSLGDLRSRNARVENVSQEYSDLSTTLEIYEAKEERYIALLADITEDEYAVAVEKELTEIQIKIANIRTRMNEIRTDVAYSYVYITLNEVKEYSAEPVKTDTFADRLSATLKDAGRGFLSFLEGLLFLIIYLAPYLVLIGIIVFVIIVIVKKRKANKRAENTLKEKEENQSEKTAYDQPYLEAEFNDSDNDKDKTDEENKE